METVRHVGPAFTDARGAITNVIEGRIEHIALITSKKGSVRGNHFHKNIHQYIYLISGGLETHCCRIDDPAKKQVLKVNPGDIIDTPPLTAHAQRFTEDSVFLALSTRKRLDGKYEEDTTAFEVVPGGHINPDLVKS